LIEMTYTSPQTNKTYNIIQTDKYGWFRYDIYDGDSKVQFALEESGIAASVRHYEGFYDGWTSSRFD